MPSFSDSSIEKLKTCHIDLQTLFNEVIKHFDCTILEGYRDKDAQDKAFAEGKTQIAWPMGNHNKTPSMAVDAMPYPIDWSDKSRIYFFAGRVLGMAEILLAQGKMTHKVRYGGDWNSDNQLSDNHFNDLDHFELVPL